VEQIGRLSRWSARLGVIPPLPGFRAVCLVFNVTWGRLLGLTVAFFVFQVAEQASKLRNRKCLSVAEALSPSDHRAR